MFVQVSYTLFLLLYVTARVLAWLIRDRNYMRATFAGLQALLFTSLKRRAPIAGIYFFPRGIVSASRRADDFVKNAS
jgi:hypothetical protein